MNRLALLLGLAVVSPAQEISTMSGDLANGLIVHISARIEPALSSSQILLLWSGIQDNRDRIHRTVMDKASNTIVGYDLFAEPDGAPDRFIVRIEPLTKRPADGQYTMLAKYPQPQRVKEGDIIALDVLVSPDGKQKLIDYIEVRGRSSPGAPVTTTSPRDFTFDDGPLSLKFKFPTRVYINGRQSADNAGFTGKPGGTVWFDIPGQGRYVLSLAPRDGFRRAGAIRDHTLSFQAGPDVYELRAAEPILGAGKAWNLYVHHDPRYQPRDNLLHYGVDRLENLLPRN
jgi:hypothetical protein